MPPRPALALLTTAAALATTAAVLVLPASPAAAVAPTSPGPDAVLTGGGWGHSVGMSQYGARSMAAKGSSGATILKHYYTGVTVDAGTSPVADTREVRVDLFLKRPGLEGSARVDVRTVGAYAPGSAPTSSVRLVLADGQALDVPAAPRSWWLSHDPAHAQFVVHEGDGEIARGPDSAPPVLSSPGGGSGSNPGVVQVLQLGTTGTAGTFRWGDLRVVSPADSGRIDPVLVQPVRNYLWGLAEVPSSWPSGALQAQAIAGRTFLGRYLGASGAWDIGATPAYQNYAGWSKESEPTYGARWVAAVDATSGQTVTYGGRLATTYYSSSHGLGRSESSEDSWAYGTSVPYLKSVADPYSSDADAQNPYATWTARASNADLAAAMGLLRVNSLRVVDRTAGLSPRTLEVDGWRPDGTRVTCRWAGGTCTTGTPSGRGAGAALRTTLALVEGGLGGRLRSQQISAITIAPFTDDETSVHQYNIGAVAAAGVASGCAPGLFCPSGTVTRGQMAAFLGRATGVVQDAGRPRFSDVDGTTFEGYINALADQGVVTGYADGTYRPDAPVTRAQMATFLVRAFSVVPASGADRFSDIADTGVHRASINAVAASGIAAGCGGDRYCPAGLVTREQMATFLARSLHLGV